MNDGALKAGKKLYRYISVCGPCVARDTSPWVCLR
jgi:hypothetical protein